MQQVPGWLDAGFILITALTLYFFQRAQQQARTSLIVLLLWAGLLAVLARAGVFAHTAGLPPRFAVVIGLPLLTILALFLLPPGRRWVGTLDPAMLTLLHVVRIPVELTLFGLFVHGAVPELMTFEGRNLDILSGISAPLVYVLAYRKRLIPRWAVVLWNLACLGLLFNIVINAILAAPFELQTQAFEQPNVAILFFPYVWLPGIVVPLVLFSHLVTLFGQRENVQRS